ncbi:unnamed protein product [Diabrotica balteata]|uniref:DNA primase large subunit C-terminal domain-containing protein n=1 Tax=Diabrotica balteata TaxID=107213 RepID=A0A9N9XHW0_DIABA|nr:unnamed protein product [Diabrotica balteata]
MSLNVYRKYPESCSSLSTIEKVCSDRIKLYKIFEAAKYNRLEVGTLQWSNYIISKIQEVELKSYYVLLGLELQYSMLKAKREDNLAHWMVGLSYSATKEQINLFINWELQWFHLLFSNLSKSKRDAFLIGNNFICEHLGPVNKLLLYDKLIQCTEVTENDFDSTKFYKTEFYKVPDLVRKKQILLDKGLAIFPEDNIVYYVKSKLCNEFSLQLEFQKKVVPNVGKYQFLIEDLPKYIPRLLGCELDGVYLRNIDQIADNHFPLCMQNLHHTLRTNHHLKYEGKMQYGVFLYWLGLPYKDAITFWKDEFTQGITEDLFNRKYLYLFQHQYGKTGRKEPYEQFYCSKILEYSPLPSQHHGCPFKHWSKSILFERLESEVSCITDIEDLVTQKEYQKACTTYLCKSRKVPQHVLNLELDVIESPIQYVNQSFKALDVLDVIFDSDENILNI